ncbi:SUMF1/EgtB/PvdO family nonheme iron enzyme [candidate division WOR-3 bacterium]|uniref:SUMF1/EgtB/PvdO family nonheme iron enzyme n=1 Tax=candidate division WOR-3 bacterium TaxID=2052148 RepID=A0A9D5K9D5_UNCW3|nr:SUMF1/EgtB/PvdO family nonheme iron enzyme [candidate division WOR-3 bacterium]MBD3364786.1 SUMF1/EgtB/PvdO family nonheme iron enzyme [candidate division WOR-3 bacterium]
MRYFRKTLPIAGLVALIACDVIDPGDLTGKGFIDIKTLPAGCEVYVNGVKQADTTDCIVDSVPKERDVVVRLVKGDYIDWQDTFDLSNTDTAFIDEVFTGILEVSSTPDGAQIWLADTNTGFTTEYKFEGILAGQWKITLKKYEYLDWEKTVTVRTHETAYADATLETDAAGIEWILIPAGWFAMGSTTDDPDAWPDEFPQHDVYLDAYYISKYEITNAQYAEFLNEHGNTYHGHTCMGITGEGSGIDSAGTTYYVKAGMASYPAIYITWYGAKAFSEWAGGRLPTEAEWEKAARGDDARLYPWGNTYPTNAHANYGKNVNEPTPVGAYPDGESPYGLLDMAGNVTEWISDWYDGDYYEVSPDTNPQGPESGSYPVKRGGNWWFAQTKIRCASRHTDPQDPFLGYDDSGFRPVKD